MGYISRIKGRNVSGVVTADAAAEFAPGGDINRWTNSFAANIGAGVRKYAPTNKRLIWTPQGKPLKASITASRPEVRPTALGYRVYAAVGSTAPYAYYVDQGTGIYGGNGPYEAKILPPWHEGSASLYEATWVPRGHKRNVGSSDPVMIKGQKGQGFFEKGLRLGFARMRTRSVNMPGEGVGEIGKAMRMLPRGLEFDGNTPSNPSFQAQLEEWRLWRDTAWDAGEGLGRGGGIGSRSHRKFMDAMDPVAKSRAKRKSDGAATKNKAKSRDKIDSPFVDDEPKDTHKTTPEEIHNKQRIETKKAEEKELRAYIANKFPGSKIEYDSMSLFNSDGRFHWVIVITVNGIIRKYDVPSSVR